MPLNSTVAKPSKSNSISPTACPKQSSTRTVSFIPLIYGDLTLGGTVISCFNQVAIFEKVKQPPMCGAFMAVLTCQTICNIIPADMHVGWYSLKKNLNIGTQAI
ncbi:hypothetical protein TNCV_1676761 [Trichonephila clavipes]|nr:hypothetical protein TNCV_1676761 [Trichonephila clavipes]